MVLARKQTTWLFVALAATVYGAVFFVTRAHTAALHAGAIGLGAACDLTITVPVLYYLLLVRPGHSSWMALVAVTLAGARAAGFLLSAAEQTYLPPLRWLGVPLEIWVVVTVARRLRRPAAGGETVTRIREAAGGRGVPVRMGSRVGGHRGCSVLLRPVCVAGAAAICTRLPIIWSGGGERVWDVFDPSHDGRGR